MTIMKKNNIMNVKFCEMGTITLVILVYFYPLASLTQLALAFTHVVVTVMIQLAQKKIP